MREAEQPEKLDLRSMDIAAAQQEKLRQLFPEVFTEGGKVDFDRLKTTLGDIVDPGKERYGMNWPGKSECFRTIQAPSRATLRPSRDESVNFDNTGNLIIEGDNLEVLKLLQKGYLGQVKMIYIDPPYNTGNDFIYPDNYSENLDTYLSYTGQADKGGKKFSTNPETDGRFHSKWLNMMYPRLFLARNLLRDDGAIFISIDDNEAANLRLILNEIFGEENFIANVVWNHTQQSKNDEKHFSRHHNQIMVFSKSDRLAPFLFTRTDEDNRAYSNPDNDPKGLWRAGDVRSPNLRETLRFPIITPSGKSIEPPENGWRWSEQSVKEKIQTGEIIFTRDETRIVRKIYLRDQEGRTPENLWAAEFAGTTRQANTELKQLFGEPPFDTPKPTSLIRKMVQLAASNDGDIILDFFAGSGSTAHAVIDQNKDDGRKRQFILVQLPERIEGARFKSISDIAKERVRLVLKDQKDNSTDLGFRVFKLDASNFKPWDGTQPDAPEGVAKQLELHVDHVLPDRSQEDILTELLLKSGFALSTRIEATQLAGKQVFSVEEGTMLVCLDGKLTPEVIKAMADQKPSRVICLDDGFQGNDQLKTNAVQTMKARGVLSFRTV